MKKICLLAVMLLSAAMCFAQDYEEDSKTKKLLNNLFIDAGGSYLKDYHFEVLPGVNYVNESAAKDFTFDIGKFKSNEDGLVDFVSFDVGGFDAGYIDVKGDSNFTYNDVLWNGSNKGNYCKIYSKNTWGPQLNLFCFSWGWVFGFQTGYQFSQVETKNAELCDSKLYEHKLFLDFVTASYFSFRIEEFVKLFVITETTLPIVNYRSAYNDSFDKEFTRKGWYWWDNEHPVALTVGVSFLF